MSNAVVSMGAMPDPEQLSLFSIPGCGACGPEEVVVVVVVATATKDPDACGDGVEEMRQAGDGASGCCCPPDNDGVVLLPLFLGLLLLLLLLHT